MKKSMLLLACVFALLTSGCVESKFPLSDPDKDEIDQSLIGTWISASGRTADRPFTASLPNTNQHFPKGVLVADYDGIRGVVIPTKIGDVRYFTTVFLGKTWKPEMGWRKDLIEGYSFVKYKVVENKLTVYGCSPEGNDRLKRSIQNGDVRGNSRGVLTEPTESLRKYIEENEAWLFTEKDERTKR